MILKILLVLDSKQFTSVTFADISKAFDTVWIKGFLLKLERYGIGENLHVWLKSYLSNRTQRVVIKDALSNIICLKTIFSKSLLTQESNETGL
jgi:hypothetical protein